MTTTTATNSSTLVRDSSSPTMHQIKCCEDTIRSHRITYKPDDINGVLASFPEKALILNSATVKPPRPRRIILIRHGQSEGNVDESAYTRVADPKIGLTEKGVKEAEESGRRIERDGADDWKVYFYVSPYRRTIDTLRNVGKAFERSRIAGVREEPRLREQDFGLLISLLENA